MKQNTKKVAWSENKIKDRTVSLGLRFIFIVSLLFIIPSAVFALNDSNGAARTIGLTGAPTMLFAMAAIGNIEQPSGRDTASNQIGTRLWLIAREQLDSTVAFPTPNANRELADITLIAGEYFHYFDGVENSIKYTGTGEQGDISPTFGKTIPVIIKYSDAALNFVEEYIGKGFILVWQITEESTKEIVGNFNKPIKLQKFEVKEDSDGKYVSLEFGNTHWRQPLKYVGNIVTAAATVVSADATALAIGTNGNYQLTNNTSAKVLITISGVASADYGRYITILAPAAVTFQTTIADNAVYILRDGTTWTGRPGSRIVFQILDSATLVEVSRVQTA
jgi:hypothetical protein